MRRVTFTVTITTSIALALSGCVERAPSSTGTAKRVEVGVILPDNKSSTRWEAYDRKYLEAAFRADGMNYDIQNAQGDPVAFQNIADQMIAEGVSVLMIISEDSQTGRAVLDRAKSQGVPTIDYDRLTLGGSATYHVSFDNTKVGQLLGEGLVKCLGEKGVHKPVIAELNGSPTDNNSTLFKNGYDAVLGPEYQSGTYLKGPDEWVPGWDNGQAAMIFEHMAERTPRIDGVLAANDGLANAAITALRKRSLAGTIPVTGQDATVQGLQNILMGDQCMTVYKDIRQEADAAAHLAIVLARGGRATGLSTRRDPTTGREVPSILLQPVAIDKTNLKDLVTDGFVSKAELCAGDLAPWCARAGIA